MSHARALSLACLVALAAASASAPAQPRDTAAVLAAQREAMQPLAALDGTWRGTATFFRPGAEPFVSRHTERIGPFLDGTLKVIEGRSFKPDGTVAFNAFAIVSRAGDRSGHGDDALHHRHRGRHLARGRRAPGTGPGAGPVHRTAAAAHRGHGLAGGRRGGSGRGAAVNHPARAVGTHEALSSHLQPRSPPRLQ